MFLAVSKNAQGFKPLLLCTATNQIPIAGSSLTTSHCLSSVRTRKAALLSESEITHPPLFASPGPRAWLRVFSGPRVHRFPGTCLSPSAGRPLPRRRGAASPPCTWGTSSTSCSQTPSALFPLFLLRPFLSHTKNSSIRDRGENQNSRVSFGPCVLTPPHCAQCLGSPAPGIRNLCLGLPRQLSNPRSTITRQVEALHTLYDANESSPPERLHAIFIMRTALGDLRIFHSAITY